MLYFFNFEYVPNNAVSNRLLGYYKSMDEMGIKAEIIYIHPSVRYDKIECKFRNIKVTYMWSKYLPYRGSFRKLTFDRYIKKFLKRLKPGDIVYSYGDLIFANKCQQIPGVRTYVERTEHPQASGYPIELLTLSDEEQQQTLHKLNGLFVISEPLKEYYSKLGVAPDKIHIINMTVDPSRFFNVKKQDCEPYIAYCGTASNNKDGVDELIKAFSIVAKKIKNVKLYIIGKTPKASDEVGNLALIKELGLADRIVFTGLVKSEDMPQMLINAKALTLDRPDNLQARYGFPTKLGEYLLTGNPVVITSVGDIPKFLVDGKSALIAKPGSPEDFSEKLMWALTHSKEASNIGLSGKAVAINNFNTYTETSKLISILR